MERQPNEPQARVCAREAPSPDPALGLLIAGVLVLLALALGTALSLLLPAAL